MGEFKLSDYSSDLVVLFLLLLLFSLMAVPRVEISVSSPWDAFYIHLLPWVLLIPLHEGLHTLTARLMGARVRFGVTTIGRFNLTPYMAIETPLPAGKYVLVSLSPLILSLVALSLAWLLHSAFWVLVYAYNTAGMAGDFVTALVLLRMPGDAEVFDDGIVLRSAEEIPRPYPVWVSSLLKVFAVIAFLLFLRLLFGRVDIVVEK
ncbi:DUF3267 domain-containing protein [Thermococcus zilligii]|uniref:DUF3267 domain-containing protein n=1 Tax=Thermococcus zilligii TaxID=54076 RepID=UPI00029A385C|nr:DUF3267 domain-containing protein [Thermococcus zilligii]